MIKKMSDYRFYRGRKAIEFIETDKTDLVCSFCSLIDRVWFNVYLCDHERVDANGNFTCTVRRAQEKRITGFA